MVPLTLSPISATRVGAPLANICSYCSLDQCAAVEASCSSLIRCGMSPILAGRMVVMRDLLSVPGQHTHVRQIAVPLSVIQSVSDHELVRNGEAKGVGLDGHLAPGWFVEQRGDAKCLRLMPEEEPLQIRKRKASVEDVLDQDDISSSHRLIHIFGDANFAGGVPPFLELLRRAGTVTVAGNTDEIKGRVEVDLACEVAEENRRTF